MADSDVPGLTALTGALSATGDLVHVVDVSDTTYAADGTDKRMTLAELATAITTHGALATDAELSAHTSDTDAAHAASAISILDTANDFTATDVEGALAELQADAETHAAAADPHAGYVLESLFDANTVIAANSDNTPAAVTVAEQTLVGRITSGNIAALSVAQVRTLLDVPTNAEAVLDTLYDAQTVVAAVSDNTPAAVTVTEETVLGRITGGNVAAINPSAVAQTIRASTANMTLVIADAGKILEFTKGTAGTVTIPSSATVNFPVGARVDVVQYGAGAATLTPGTTGVVIRSSTQLTLVTNGQYSGCTLYKHAANSWVAIGDLVVG